MKIAIFSDLQCYNEYSWNKLMNDGLSKDIKLIVTLGDIDLLDYRKLKYRFNDRVFIGVHGNHDSIGDLENLRVNNNHLKFMRYNKLVFLGFEGCVRYKGEICPMYSQEECEKLLKNKNKCDILISHNSPFGIHDREDLSHAGFKGLLNYIEHGKPKYHFHGHQHHNKTTVYGDTIIMSIYGGFIVDLSTGERIKILDMD